MNLIRPFDPWGNPFCTCLKKYSLSPYTGCGHGCLYCYASSYIKNFYSPREKKDFLKRLKREIKRLPPHSLITIANSSDPYLPLEKSLRLSRKMLEAFECYDARIMIVTKSTLVLRDIPLLKNIKKVVVSITLTTLNPSLVKKLEPFCPSPLARLKAMEKLAKYFPVVCRFDPLIYPLNTKAIKKVLQAIQQSGARQVITSTYKVRTDNFKRMVRAFPEHEDVWRKLYQTQGEKMNGYSYLPQEMRTQLIEEVRSISIQNGLAFSSCREGLNKGNTRLCDGSSWF